MKNVKNIILGMVFLFGLTSSVGANTAPVIKVDCNASFTVCDNNASYAAELFPALVSYQIEWSMFVNCMNANGC